MAEKPIFSEHDIDFEVEVYADNCVEMGYDDMEYPCMFLDFAQFRRLLEMMKKAEQVIAEIEEKQ
jgi:hypothetical protein